MKRWFAWRWLTSAGAALVLISVLFVATRQMLVLEAAEHEARAEIAREAAISQALWLLEAELTELVARETRRPYFEYQTFYAPSRTYQCQVDPPKPGEVLAFSPVARGEPGCIALWFQLDGDRITSPQAPGDPGVLLELAPPGARDEYEAARAALTRLEGRLDRQALRDVVRRAAPDLGGRPPPELVRAAGQSYDTAQVAQVRDDERGVQAELENWSRSKLAKIAAAPPVDVPVEEDPTLSFVEHGTVVGLWLPPAVGDESPALILTRRVLVRDVELIQGALVDWDALARTLTEVVVGLLPEAQIVPAPPELSGRRMGDLRPAASLPIAIDPGGLKAAPLPRLTPARVTMVVTWIAVFVALAAAAAMLRSATAHAERQRRFASAVAHELRTPLTTFRLYTEMLATGMVTDSARRQEYIETLDLESQRLARLVENVLAYARLEEGRLATRRQPIAAAAIVDSLRPELERRAASANLSLHVDLGEAGQCPVSTDPLVAAQILINLVDNACKYAVPSDPPRLEIEFVERPTQAAIRVRDHGPGIAPTDASRIFAPFERGRTAREESKPGVGLGLALARGLARELGGDVLLATRPAPSGAAFELWLPRAGPTPAP